MIAVVHTFGSNIRFNPHVHALIPEIKTRGKEVREMGYFDYEYLKKIWQYKLINYMISNFSKDPMKCLKCGELMELWQIWHRKYGYIYDMGTY